MKNLYDQLTLCSYLVCCLFSNFKWILNLQKDGQWIIKLKRKLTADSIRARTMFKCQNGKGQHFSVQME